MTPERLAEIIDNLIDAANTAELAETMTGEEVARMLREVAEQLRK